MSARRSHRLRNALAGLSFGVLCGWGAWFLADIVSALALHETSEDKLLFLTCGAVLGLAFGLRTWPDPASRNRQDPPGLHRPPEHLP